MAGRLTVVLAFARGPATLRVSALRAMVLALARGAATLRAAAPLATVLALAAGCGSGQSVVTGCGPAQCTGCCTAEGRCATEDTFEACGSGGLACARCSPGTSCVAGSCQRPDGGASIARPGESCATPLALVPGSAPVQLRLAAYRPDTELSCATAARPDAVASLTVVAPTTLALFARTLSGSGRPTLAVRRTCGDGASELAFACVDQPQAHGSAAWLGELEAGTFSVWVQADADAVVALEAVALPTPGARCDAPAPLALDFGSTRLRAAPLSVEPSGCSQSLARGRLLQLPISDESDLRVTAADAAVTLGLYEGCGSVPLACAGGSLTRAGLQRGAPVLAALTGSALGALELDLELRRPAVGERCPLPFEVSVPSTPLVVTGSTRVASSDLLSPCGGAGSPDVVYRLSSAVNGALSATVEAADGGFQPVLSFHGPLCTGTLLTCSQPTSQGRSSLSWSNAEGYLWVSGEDGGAGDYALTLQVRPRGAGDSCAQPEVLTLSVPGTVTVMGDTRNDNNDSPGTCGSTSADHVYSLKTAASYNLVATLSPVGSLLAPSLAYASPCTRQLSCSLPALPDAGAARLRLGGLPADTHTLWVDGLAGTAGPYGLRVELTPRVPGDTCTNPLVVPVGGGAPVTLSIDQAAYFDSTSFSCGGGGFNDVHLNFRPLEVGLLRVTAQRADGGRPPLLSRQCQSNGFACIPADGGQVGLTLRIDDPTTGDTALSLDEVGPEGVVTVTASLQTPAPGDWCSGAVPLPLDDAGTATVSGDTRGFEDEPFAPYCGWRGPDAFYSIAARPYARLVQATVIPTAPGFQPGLAVQGTNRSCTSLSGGCTGLQPAGQSVSAQFNLQANTQGLVSIDSPTPDAGGAFTLLVTVTPP